MNIRRGGRGFLDLCIPLHIPIASDNLNVHLCVTLIVPSAITKTPSAKLNKSQMPLLSSTPAVTASALSEETIGKSVLRSQWTVQEEATLHHGNRGVLDGNDQEVAHATEERGPRHDASERGPSVSFVDASSPDDDSGDTAKQAYNLEDGLKKPPVVVATPEETESAPEIPESTDSTAASGGFSLDGSTVFKPEETNYEYQSKKPIVVTSKAAVTAESQTALNATDTEPSKPSRGSFHPAVTEKVKKRFIASFLCETEIVFPCVSRGF